ncbi:hypothetical protein PoB_004935800 [Plakobranchus ocellatus]|uniref:CCHC-type domain-containing protein n=1 Tax=Plakobranchus ocellatus TaxID=259542 RepID=A0AAV4BTD1_9GAST|nr:hypothetical protein PoB_004935800 [Plakobranchus ocellatus]
MLDLYKKYIQLADNLGIDQVSRLEWVQSHFDREIEEQKLKLGLDERAAEREAEMILQEEFEKQKQLDAQAKGPQKRSFSASSDDQSSSDLRRPVLGRRAWTSNTDASSRRLLCYVCNDVGHLTRQCFGGPVGSQRTVRPNPIGNTPGTVSVSSYCRRPGHARQTCFKLRNRLLKLV